MNFTDQRENSMITAGDHVRKTEGIRDLGREGVVTAVSAGMIGGDHLVTVDGTWTAYVRQLTKI